MEKPGVRSRIVPIVLFILAGVLLASSVTGYVLQGTRESVETLDQMRTSAVLHAASEGLINSIAQQARADKLAELRKDKNFRKRGLDEVNAICDGAMNEARAEAEKLYANPVVQDKAALENAISAFEKAVAESNALSQKERSAYADIYVQLVDNTSDWKAVAGEEVGDEAVISALGKTAPELLKDQNAHLKAGFLRLARDLAVKQQAREDAEAQTQLQNLLYTAVADWTGYVGLDQDAVWDKLKDEVPEIASGEKFRDAVLSSAQEHIAAAEKGETLAAPAEAEAGAETVSETQADYQYFAPSEELTAKEAAENAAYEELNAQLVAIIPDLSTLSGKLQNTLRENIEKVLWLEDDSFSARYNTYRDHQAEPEAGACKLNLASLAKSLLLAGVAVLLLGLVVFFWAPLTERFGVSRTIIALFFVYLCLLAEFYNISVRMMLGNVLERMSMYGVLVLAMMPGIQCGISLNMGMTIGCISGLLGIVLALQLNMVGFAAMLFACLCGAVVSLPLGWSYSKLLNRMKGNEMTISTYVGFSFVSLMCIAWMMLPFNNPKIIWLLSGKGLRVTHSLLGSFAHLLDNLLSFKAFGIKVPTGGLLFLGLCCFAVWLFSRSRLGIAMTAAGSNPRFAEASGINVNHMRTVGTVLSTVIAAVGIVIYSQAFGYAQLYTAPRQLGFVASSAILIGGATVSKAKVSHVIIGVFLFEGVLVFGQQIANSIMAGGGLSEVMRIMISNGIILYALTQTGGGQRA